MQDEEMETLPYFLRFCGNGTSPLSHLKLQTIWHKKCYGLNGIYDPKKDLHV